MGRQLFKLFQRVFSNVQNTQLRCLFVLMLFHALDNVGQADDSFDNIRPFIEHDAFSPFTHGGVCNFSPRRDAGFDQIFQDLRGPNDGDVGSFANPKDFFLQLCQAVVARFDGQIAPGNHDAKGVV